MRSTHGKCELCIEEKLGKLVQRHSLESRFKCIAEFLGRLKK